jgi:GT2 family glycosyltransferase
VRNDSGALIITVNFRHAECTLQFLNSSSRLEAFANCHLLIVDNNSDDGSLCHLRDATSRFSQVELLPSSENRGYFGAASWALRQFLASHSMPDWVIVCNNDIAFEDRGFLSKLLKKDPSAAGVIAPAIISELTGRDANPSIRQRPNRFQMFRYRLWLSNYYAMWCKQWLSPFVRIARNSFFQPSAVAESRARRAIYAPHGSFLIFSRKFFEAGGFIDNGFFMYAEEFCVAEMCLRLGLPVIHDPDLRVRHEESQTTGRMLSRSMYVHQKNGFQYALARYKDSYPELTATPSVMQMKSTHDPGNSTISAAGDRAR